MKYKSKIDWWFHLSVIVFCAFTAYTIYAASLGNATMLLAVRSGLFTKKVIPYNMIVSCQPGSVTGDSAALSRDRLVITYFKNGKKKNIIVSPKDKFDFVTELKLKQKENGSDEEN